MDSFLCPKCDAIAILGYSPVWFLVQQHVMKKCRLSNCRARLYVCANESAHMHSISQWSRSVLLWSCLNSCSIKTSLVTTCEILCIFPWPLSHFQSFKLFGFVRLRFKNTSITISFFLLFCAFGVRIYSIEFCWISWSNSLDPHCCM